MYEDKVMKFSLHRLRKCGSLIMPPSLSVTSLDDASMPAHSTRQPHLQINESTSLKSRFYYLLKAQEFIVNTEHFDFGTIMLVLNL